MDDERKIDLNTDDADFEAYLDYALAADEESSRDAIEYANVMAD